MRQRFTRSSNIKIPDPVIEGVRQTIDQRIDELQGAALDIDIIRGVSVSVNGVANVAHKLRRNPRFVSYSVPRVAQSDFLSLTVGTIVELTPPAAFTVLTPLNRAEVIQIGAFGFSVPIIVDVMVM